MEGHIVVTRDTAATRKLIVAVPTFSGAWEAVRSGVILGVGSGSTAWPWVRCESACSY